MYNNSEYRICLKIYSAFGAISFIYASNEENALHAEAFDTKPSRNSQSVFLVVIIVFA